MAIAHYIFETPGGDWWINHHGKRHGPYATKQAALKLAVRTAGKAGGAGRNTRIFLHGSDGNSGPNGPIARIPFHPTNNFPTLRVADLIFARECLGPVKIASASRDPLSASSRASLIRDIRHFLSELGVLS